MANAIGEDIGKQFQRWLHKERAKGMSPCLQTKDRVHIPRIEGKPLTLFTWYVCNACGLRWYRG